MIEKTSSILPLKKLDVEISFFTCESFLLATNFTKFDRLNSTYLILYDYSPKLIRQIEIMKSLDTDSTLNLYTLLYLNSAEEQIYLSQLRQEKDAFEKLIKERSVSTPSEYHLT